jgi:hypothetical protein
VVRIAPRYDPRIFDAIRALDDRKESIAEVCRRINSALDALGVSRVSYVHLRRLVQDHRAEEDFQRARRKELFHIAGDVYADATFGRRIDPYEVADRVREAGH